jgi:methylmalonyl-CoA/ethylmalonyl-CoA epimerase
MIGSRNPLAAGNFREYVFGALRPRLQPAVCTPMTENNESRSEVSIIDHVGIAVNSIESSAPRWAALLGGGPDGEETVASEGVRVAFFGRGPGRIELLEPAGDDSPIARFLERRGAGIHHICVRVDDLAAALDEAEGRGLEPIPPRIRAGAEGARVAFLHPRTTDGVLLELRQERPGE